jgi:hypothetical protein
MTSHRGAPKRVSLTLDSNHAEVLKLLAKMNGGTMSTFVEMAVWCASMTLVSKYMDDGTGHCDLSPMANVPFSKTQIQELMKTVDRAY